MKSTDVKFTHLDRIVFPASKITKGDVIEYYAKVADKLLPHLRDRPVTLERFPEGIGEKAPRFWQKNTPEYYPKWIKRVALPTEKGTKVSYTLVNDLQTLLYLANQNVLTFHVWFSRVQKPDVPDFVLFDIDPHQSTFANAIKVAVELHALLDKEEKIENFIKTSGKTGLHVLTPWNAKKGGYEEARSWAAEVAQRVADRLPRIATTERSIDRRGNRVYVDAMQNAKGKHSVAPYSLRATPNATVSMPLKWSEVTAKLSPEKFDLKSALQRIVKEKSDPLISLTGNAPRKRGG